MNFIKDTLIIIGVTLLGIVIIVGGLTAYNLAAKPVVEKPLAGQYDNNTITGLTSFATSTGSYCSMCPVQLLSYNPDRKYIKISNVSDTAVFLYVTSTPLSYHFTGELTDTSTNVTSTIKTFPHNGIQVGANTTVTFESADIPIGFIWASSTAALKQINISYK